MLLSARVFIEQNAAKVFSNLPHAHARLHAHAHVRTEVAGQVGEEVDESAAQQFVLHVGRAPTARVVRRGLDALQERRRRAANRHRANVNTGGKSHTTLVAQESFQKETKTKGRDTGSPEIKTCSCSKVKANVFSFNGSGAWRSVPMYTLAWFASSATRE